MSFIKLILKYMSQNHCCDTWSSCWSIFKNQHVLLHINHLEYKAFQLLYLFNHHVLSFSVFNIQCFLHLSALNSLNIFSFLNQILSWSESTVLKMCQIHRVLIQIFIREIESLSFLISFWVLKQNQYQITMKKRIQNTCNMTQIVVKKLHFLSVPHIKLSQSQCFFCFRLLF